MDFFDKITVVLVLWTACCLIAMMIVSDSGYSKQHIYHRWGVLAAVCAVSASTIFVFN